MQVNKKRDYKTILNVLTVSRLYWNYIKTILRLYWDYIETILELYWDYIKSILRLYWDYIKTISRLTLGVSGRPPQQVSRQGLSERDTRPQQHGRTQPKRRMLVGRQQAARQRLDRRDTFPSTFSEPSGCFMKPSLMGRCPRTQFQLCSWHRQTTTSKCIFLPIQTWAIDISKAKYNQWSFSALDWMMYGVMWALCIAIVKWLRPCTLSDIELPLWASLPVWDCRGEWRCDPHWN